MDAAELPDRALIEGEKIVGTITIVEDVTERVTRERGIESTDDEKERLLISELAARRLAEENSRVKDEFLAPCLTRSGPLNAIRGWGLILRRGDVDAQTFDHALETIDRKCRPSRSSRGSSRYLEDGDRPAST